MPDFIDAKFNSSSEMCNNILKKTGVALLPGSDFGFDEKKMIARLSFTDFDGNNFIKEYERDYVINDKLISRCAPKVVEGVDMLKKWSDKL